MLIHAFSLSASHFVSCTVYTPVHISCMCYVSCLKVTRWPQHDVRDGLFAHSVGHDAEWFENFWNWLRKHENAFFVHDVFDYVASKWAEIISEDDLRFDLFVGKPALQQQCGS